MKGKPVRYNFIEKVDAFSLKIKANVLALKKFQNYLSESMFH